MKNVSRNASADEVIQAFKSLEDNEYIVKDENGNYRLNREEM